MVRGVPENSGQIWAPPRQASSPASAITLAKERVASPPRLRRQRSARFSSREIPSGQPEPSSTSQIGAASLSRRAARSSSMSSYPGARRWIGPRRSRARGRRRGGLVPDEPGLALEEGVGGPPEIGNQLALGMDLGHVAKAAGGHPHQVIAGLKGRIFLQRLEGRNVSGGGAAALQFGPKTGGQESRSVPWFGARRRIDLQRRPTRRRGSAAPRPTDRARSSPGAPGRHAGWRSTRDPNGCRRPRRPAGGASRWGAQRNSQSWLGGTVSLRAQCGGVQAQLKGQADRHPQAQGGHRRAAGRDGVPPPRELRPHIRACHPPAGKEVGMDRRRLAAPCPRLY